MVRRTILLLLLVWGLGNASVAHAVAIGTFSFDSLIPGPDGVNAFTIVNLTGDPSTGGFALPPDFPVVTPLSFHSGGINLLLADGSVRFLSLEPIPPGPFPDPSAKLQFPDTDAFQSATFMATLTETELLLADGTTFRAAPKVTGNLVPAVGAFLTPGADFVILEAIARPISVPTPTAWLLLASGAAVIWRSGLRRPTS